MESKNKSYTVYLHRSPSGKVYVGQTCDTLKRRWKNGKGYSRNVYFNAAIEKYGWENFTHEVLVTNLSKTEADNFERMFIQCLESDSREYGYNIQSGGHHAGEMSEEAKARMISSKIGDKNCNARPVTVFDCNGNRLKEFTCCSFAASHYQIKRSTLLTHLRKRSGTCGGFIFRYSEEVQNVNVLPTEETYSPHEKRSLRGDKAYNARSVVVYDNNLNVISRFSSIQACANSFSVDASSVHDALTGKSKTCKGFGIKYEDQELTNEEMKQNFERKTRSKAVDMYSRDGQYITTFQSISSAAASVGGSFQAISNVFRGKSQTAYGYIWKPHTDKPKTIAPASTTAETRKKNHSYRTKPIWQLDPITKERIRRFESIAEAARFIHRDKHNIAVVCQGKKRTCGGFAWEFDCLQ